MLKKKKILVFGSRGYIGSKFCDSIKKNNIVHQPKFETNKINLGDFHFNKINNLIKNNKYTHIVNFHAHTDIVKSNKDFQYDFYHNCSIVHSIVKSLILNSSKTFFLNIGTVTQLGYTNVSKKIKIDYSSRPNNIFDFHKQYNEDFIRINKLNFDLKATTLRFSNIFGLSLNNTFSKNRGAINNLINTAVDKNFIELFGTGKNIRDFLYIEDAIKGLEAAIMHSKKLNDDYYYLTSGIGVDFNKLAQKLNYNLKKIYDNELKISYKNWPTDTNILNKRNFVGNPDSFEKITGWKPKFNLNQAINHYLNNKN